MSTQFRQHFGIGAGGPNTLALDIINGANLIILGALELDAGCTEVAEIDERLIGEGLLKLGR